MFEDGVDQDRAVSRTLGFGDTLACLARRSSWPRRLRPCRLAGAAGSRVRPGGEPVEDDAEMPFEALVAVVEEVPGLLHQ